MKLFLLLFYCQLLEILDTRDLIPVVKSGRGSAPQDWDGDGSDSRPGHRHTGHDCYQLDQRALHVSLRLASVRACVCVGVTQTDSLTARAALIFGL